MAIRVLVVDDHGVVREGLRLLLESELDIRVVGEAGDGGEAVLKAQAVRPDVVVMDIAMPVLGGLEATQRLSESCPDARVVVVSMHGTAEHVARAFRAGARAFVLKESAGKEVLDAVRAAHAGRRYVSRKIADRCGVDELRGHRSLPPEGRLERLSAREREVLRLVVEGRSSAEIARLLTLSPKTVETYRSRLMTKLSIDNLPGLVKFAIQEGLTSA